MLDRSEHAENDYKRRIRRISVFLESRIQSADVAESMIVEFCGATAGEYISEQVGLAIRESVANAVVHGNRLDMTKKVQMTAELSDTGLTVCIIDEGEGFDPESLRDPLLPDNLLNESGRGFFLVKTCMDDVTVRRAKTRGTELTLVKHLTKSSPMRRGKR